MKDTNDGDFPDTPDSQTLALAGADIRSEANFVYERTLARELSLIELLPRHQPLINDLCLNDDTGFNNHDSFKKIIVSNHAEPVLRKIWIESRWLQSSALEENGLSRHFIDRKKITVNGLKDAICDDYGLPHAAGESKRAFIERVCKALEVYRLIVRSKNNPKLKPLRGTLKLHKIMMRVNREVVEVIARAGE